jgi:phosphatidylinositol alpha 1,6-mannosyltransferase
MLRFLPGQSSKKIQNFAERKILAGAVLYYKMPKVVLAPNQELVDLLGKGTNRASFLMGRGVDTEFFSPDHRTVKDNIVRLGFVGRLRAEKNVRMLAEIEKELIRQNKTNYRFLIVGEGNERDYLQRTLKRAEFTGFLEGEQLSEAYANMDIFVFPSETDAFGNVTQEATASGIVPIVSDKGGPKFLVSHGETGFVAEAPEDYAKYVIELLDDPDKLAKMRKAARGNSLARSWDSIFEGVYDAYHETLRIAEERKAMKDKGSTQAEARHADLD